MCLWKKCWIFTFSVWIHTHDRHTVLVLHASLSILPCHSTPLHSIVVDHQLLAAGPLVSVCMTFQLPLLLQPCSALPYPHPHASLTIRENFLSFNTPHTCSMLHRTSRQTVTKYQQGTLREQVLQIRCHPLQLHPPHPTCNCEHWKVNKRERRTLVYCHVCQWLRANNVISS